MLKKKGRLRMQFWGRRMNEGGERRSQRRTPKRRSRQGRRTGMNGWRDIDAKIIEERFILRNWCTHLLGLAIMKSVRQVTAWRQDLRL